MCYRCIRTVLNHILFIDIYKGGAAEGYPPDKGDFGLIIHPITLRQGQHVWIGQIGNKCSDTSVTGFQPRSQTPETV